MAEAQAERVDRVTGPASGGVAATCRGSGAALTSAVVNPQYCRPCLSRIPFPGMDWQARLPGRLHAMTSGETPAVFRCLADAALPVRPLADSVRPAFDARYPGHGRELDDWLRSYVATCGYLSALSVEGAMRHDIDGLSVVTVELGHRERAAAWLASPWVSGDRADREAHVEGLARSGRCSMAGGRCMVTADSGPMGQLRIEAPAFLCARPARGAHVGGTQRVRPRDVDGGPWSVVGRGRRGGERY